MDSDDLAIQTGEWLAALPELELEEVSEISEDDLVGVALAIFLDFQWRWEAHQEQCQSAFSSYSIEDLPSNMLAFIADMQGDSTAELLEQLGAYKANREAVSTVSEESLRKYCEAESVPVERAVYPTEELPLDGIGRLVDFLPKRLDIETCQYEVVEWPWELPLPVNKINGVRVWCRVSQIEEGGVASSAFYEFDGCWRNDE